MIEEWYVGFWPRTRGDFWSCLGHVDVWGRTADGTWVFIDPQRIGTQVEVAHQYDRVNLLLTARFHGCEEIWRTTHHGSLRFPTPFPFYCISVVAHILGLRAWTYRGLRRRLRETGAECIHEAAEGRPE